LQSFEQAIENLHGGLSEKHGAQLSSTGRLRPGKNGRWWGVQCESMGQLLTS